MAEAIIGGIVDAGIAAADSIGVGEPVGSRRKYLEDTYGLKPHSDNLEAVDGASLTVLAVKPQSLPYVFPQLAGQLDTGNTVLSIVAGANMKTLTSGLVHEPVIRVMPNTPAQIGAGMTMWTASDSVSEEAKDTTRSILQTLGEEVYAYDEGMIDMATALSASGPRLRIPVHRGADRRGRISGTGKGCFQAVGASDGSGQYAASQGQREAPRGTQGYGHVARRHDHRGAESVRGRRISGRGVRGGQRGIRKVPGSGRIG